MFFQQFKRSYEAFKERSSSSLSQETGTRSQGAAASVGTGSGADKLKPNPKLSGLESLLLGAVAAAGSVAVMNPMDTIKTRLVTQVGMISYHTKLQIY